MKMYALLFFSFSCIFVVAYAEPGKVYIMGECVDCNRDGVPETPFPVRDSGAAVQTLTTGAAAFGLLYYSIGALLRNMPH
ncbi:bomanin Tailed 2 isoform X2 [Drosophila sulfurigaster albostrigata]|uniref:bomanin Tailed 2 isoform X2 n=1 Tax=Drosophila sulfurigaster albostrigata TaxID=89887 RepID=UPI002D218E54|nr:bomanin Tailed 2 isoform X2 [Drosophila sulfurigaster albostrigata]